MAVPSRQLAFRQFGPADTASLLQRVRAFSRKTYDFTDTYGRDLQVLARSEAAFGPRGTRKAFYRPAQEPIYESLWPELMAINFDNRQAVDMASLLCGQRTEPRVGRIVGLGPDGKRREFARKFDPYWPDLMREGERRFDCPVERAAYRFAFLIEQHPFADGNGRFARALVASSLAQSDVARFPSLGIGGAIEVFKAEFCEASALFANLNAITGIANCLMNSMELSLLLLSKSKAVEYK